MSDVNKQLTAFAEANRAEILEAFTRVLSTHEKMENLELVRAKISYASDVPEDHRDTIEHVDGGFIIWKDRGLNAELDAILAAMDPPVPMRIDSLLLRNRDAVVVYEDAECTIYMYK